MMDRIKNPDTPEEQQIAGEGAELGAGNLAENRSAEDGELAADEQQQNHEHPETASSIESRVQEFDEDFRRTEHAEFMQEQINFFNAEFSNRSENKFACSRLRVMKVFGGGDGDEMAKAKIECGGIIGGRV
jgi:hypothetical protein